MTTNLANSSIDDLKNIESVLIGKFNLLQNNIKKLKNKGYIYVDTNYKWNQLKQGYIYFNIIDKNGNNIINTINNLIAENIYKTNFLIIKIESELSTNSVFFYVNSPLNITDFKNNIVEFLVVANDFVDYQGYPNVNENYKMSYLLKDPSLQLNLKSLPLLSKDTTVSTNQKKFVPIPKPKYKERKIIPKSEKKIKVKTHSHFCYKMYTSIIIIILIVITSIIIIINNIKIHQIN